MHRAFAGGIALGDEQGWLFSFALLDYTRLCWSGKPHGRKRPPRANRPNLLLEA